MTTLPNWPVEAYELAEVLSKETAYTVNDWGSFAAHALLQGLTKEQVVNYARICKGEPTVAVALLRARNG